MEYIEKIDHLRVINFDKPVSETEISCANSQDLQRKVFKCEKVRAYNGHTIETDFNKNAHSIRHKPIKEKDSTNAKCINFKSPSDLFRYCRESKIVRHVATNTRSLEDIRKRIINLSSTNIPNFRKKVQRRRNNENKKRNMWCRQNDQSQDDIKVLYVYERSKDKKDRKDIPTISNIASNIKRSSSQIFGTINSRNNNYLCYQTCRNTGLFPTPKRRKKETDLKTYFLRKSHPLCIKNCKSNMRLNNSVHLNLVGFPICLDKNKVLQPSCSISQQLLWTDEQLSPIDCTGDAGANKILMEPVGPCISPETDEKPVCLDKQFSTELKACHIKSYKVQPVNRFFAFFKTCSSYLLTGLVIVVWLPCIIIGIVCLYIMSLMGPQRISDHNLGENKCSRVKICKCNKFVSIIRWFTNSSKCLVSMVRDLMSTENVTIIGPYARQESMPQIPCQVTAIRRKKRPGDNSKWQPNPGKRYMLYHNNSRGWLMKPQRKDIYYNYQDVLMNKSCSHCDRGWETRIRKQDKTVTFWDAQDKPCECIKKVDADVQSDIIDMDEKVVKVQPKVFKPCPLMPCPVRERNRKYQKEIIKKLNASIRSREIAYNNHLIKVRRGVPADRDCNAVRNRNPNIVRYKNRYHDPLRDRMRTNRCARRIVSDPAICSKRFCRDGVITPKKKTLGEKICTYCKDCWRDLKEDVHSAEKVWGEEIECGNLYLTTLKRRPCFWIHRRWPHLYPCFLAWHQMCSNCCRGCMIFVACCVWCPLFFCIYITTKIFCMACN